MVAPTLLVVLLWVTVGGVTTYYIKWLYEFHARVLAENVATIQAAGAMQDILWRLQVVVTQAPEQTRSETRLEMAELESAFEEQLDVAVQTAVTPEEQTLVRLIGERFTLYKNRIHRPVSVAEAAGSLPAAPDENAMHLARRVAEVCKQLLELNEKLLTASTARSTRLGALVYLVRLSFLIAGPAIGILFGVIVARGLHRSLSRISVTLKDATGDLEHEVGCVDAYPAGDLPALQQQVQVVSNQIRRVMGELQAARHEAMRAERLAAVGQLAAGVAHELRNPLTSVKLLIQRAAQRAPGRALTERQLYVIQEEITRMENTIQGLLDFARPPRLHRLPHDIRDTVQRARNLVVSRARQREISIVEEFPSAPVIVDGDPEQLHQVFVNLLLNGVDAMRDGGVLRVSIDQADDLGSSCRIAFRDSGGGIAPAIMERLFEPFVTDKEHGTGLGLAVSRRIVEEHGGKLTASNRQEGGAVFTVELPLQTARPTSTNQPTAVA
ncbi:MAG: sensor histidine kinase [Pirellulales bacterium]